MAAKKIQDSGPRPAKGSDFDKKQKLMKKLPKSQVEELDAMNEQDLRLTIVRSENNIMNIKNDMEANPEFIKAKDGYDLAKAPYDEATKHQKCVIGYALIALRDGGKLSDETEGLMAPAEESDDDETAEAGDGSEFGD